MLKKMGGGMGGGCRAYVGGGGGCFPTKKKTAQAGIQLMYRRREIEKGLSAPRGAKEKRVK